MSNRKDSSKTKILSFDSIADNENQSIDVTTTEMVDSTNWCTSGGERHDWRRWRSDFTPVAKFKCEREGCGFFKKCWLKCKDKDTTCNGCHVIGHQRWGWEKPKKIKK